MSGMYWLIKDDSAPANLDQGVEYFTYTHLRYPAAISIPRGEIYPQDYRGIPIRARDYVPAHHFFMWLEKPEE